MSNNLHMVHTQNFNYSSFNREFSAKISTFGCRGIDRTCAQFFQQLNQGVGFIVVKQGKRIPVKLVKTNKVPSDWDSEDFDVSSWIFKPTDFREDFTIKLLVD